MLLGDSVSCMCGGDGVSRTHGWVFIIHPLAGTQPRLHNTFARQTNRILRNKL
jgi:hypothetical protein